MNPGAVERLPFRGAKRRPDLSLGCQAQECQIKTSSAESVVDYIAYREKICNVSGICFHPFISRT